MKNSFGNNITVTLFGESHGNGIGFVLDGVAPGLCVDTENIKNKLALRKSERDIATSRNEADEFKILSGVFEGKTCGTPICLVIENKDTKSKDYNKIKSVARPSHADFTAFCKYNGYNDYRGGGHFSGRITAPLVAAGAILEDALNKKGIYIATHIKQIYNIFDDDFSTENLNNDVESLQNKMFAVLNEEKGEEMKTAIRNAKQEGDSLGGILETCVVGLPKGVGEPWFDTVESQLAHILFAVPAVKGVEFGLGFGFADKKGSEANDALFFDGESIKTKTNNNGGINGGITNGMPITFKTSIKPTPTILKEQETVDFNTNENIKTNFGGRHDPCIVSRAATVINSVTAICLCDILSTHFGTDWLSK